MASMKRTLSVLLAIVMVFSTMTIAFTVASAAVPIVPRIETMNPAATFTVPQYLFVRGTNAMVRGNTVEGGATIRLEVQGASDVTLECVDEPAVSFNQSNQVQGQSTTWTIGNGGSISGANDYVQWHARYKVGAKYYDTYAWSAIKKVYNDPGFSTRYWAKVALVAESQNYHIEWITPVYGNYYNSSGWNCYIDKALGDRVDVDSGDPTASALHERVETDTRNIGGGDGVVATGNYYVDKSQISNLNETPLRIGGGHNKVSPIDTDGDHWLHWRGLSLTAQKKNGSDTSGYSVTFNEVTEIKSSNALNTVVAETISGPISTLNGGDKLDLSFTTHWKGNRSFPSKSTDSYGHYTISIFVYDKGTLASTLAEVTQANYQKSQYYTSAPGNYGSNTAFRTWDQYMAALKQAWYIYGKEDVTQAQINDANDKLVACKPKYSGSGSNSTWQSGMMMCDADYSAAELLIDSLPTRYKEYCYNDGEYGKFYKYSFAGPINQAVADIRYESTPLRSSYQDVVDQMKDNLLAAIENMGTGTATYKDVSVVFTTETPDVRDMPSAVTTPLFTTVTKPSVDPKKDYYRFDGWFLDQAMTVPVSWPLSTSPLSNNPASAYFAANLNTRSDDAGTAFTLYGKFTLTGTTLYFVTNGGSAVDSVIGNMGDPYSGPTTVPTRAGYNFVGWYVDLELETPVDWSTFKFGDSTQVFAKWERASFTVTFNANNGTFPSTGMATKRVTDLFGNAVAKPETPQRSGYGFVGWCSDAATTQLVNIDTFTIPSENTTLYAKWSNTMRNVTFVFGNGLDPVTESYEINTKISAPTQPYRAGYDFVGWFLDSYYTQPISFPYTVPSQNVTIYAGWNPQKFSITFSAGAGSMAADYNASAYQNLNCGSTIIPPTTPTREGFVFNGWTLNGDPYELTTVPPYDLYLEASWAIEPPTAHFRLRTDKTGTLEQGDIVNATVSLRTNYITGTTTFIVYYDSRYMKPARNGVLYTNRVQNATACSKTPGEAYFTVVQNEGVTNVTDTASNLTLTGRVNVSDSGGLQNYYPADWLDVTIVGNKTTYSLKEEYKFYEYVYFNAGESIDGTHAQPVIEQDIATFQFIVTEDDKYIGGTAQLLMPQNFCKTSTTGKEKISCAQEETIEYIAGADVTIFDGIVYDLQNNDVRFTVQAMQTSTVTYDSKGGSALQPLTDKVGRTVQLSVPEKANHNFLGWTTTENGTDYVDANAFVMPEQDITLYAQWKGNATTYYVYHYLETVEEDGFMEPICETKTGDIGTAVSAVPNTYEGFYCSNSDSGTIPTVGYLTLKLYYFRTSVSITLDAASGTFTGGAQSVTLNGKYGQPIRNTYGDPARTGYAFKGWKYGTDAYELTTYPAVSAMTLVADWEAETYTLTFVLDGTVYTEITQAYNTPIAAPSVDPGEGQTFSGWRNSAGQPFSYTRMPAGNETFTGTLASNGYKITLVVDGKQYGQPILFEKGAVITADMVVYSPPIGYSFDGWHTTKSLTSAKYSFPLTLNEDKTFYGFTAQETYTIQTMVYLPADVGGEDMFEDWGSITGQYGDSVVSQFAALESQLTDSDECGFNGWYLDEDLTIPYATPTMMPAENLVIYGALYLRAGTVIFNANGGEGSVDSITEPIGGTIVLPGGDGVSNQYYRFVGWGAAADSTDPITSIEITEEGEIMVYAIWVRNYANITFQTNGGTGAVPDPMRGEVGSTVSLPDGSDLAKEGFLFAGWAADRNATSGSVTLSVTSVNDVVLYAIWAPLQVTLIARAGSTAVIDNERGFIYGLKEGVTEAELLTEYLDLEGDGTIEIESAIMIGTGVKVNVINSFTGKTDATYTIVIFGDVDGNGRISTEDITRIKAHVTGVDAFAAGSAQLFAADLNNNGGAELEDTIVMKGIITGVQSYDQVNHKIKV